MIPAILFVSKQLQVRLSAIKFYCQRAREDFSLVFLRETRLTCKRLEILREKLRGTTLKFESSIPDLKRESAVSKIYTFQASRIKCASHDYKKVYLFVVLLLHILRHDDQFCRINRFFYKRVNLFIQMFFGVANDV